ncbi:MAG: hypothetical protein Q8880_04680, partial [Bacteroidota bacterium]|nr:hypothetical protein [Bacteroidota bacterium]
MFIKIKKEGISNICKRYFHYILLIFILNIICPSFVRSEGTREFKGNKKNKCQISFCSSSYSNLASYNSDTNHRLYIHINNPGEIIYYGFTNSYYSSYNYYRIKKPDGSIAVSESYFPSSGQVGYINNIDEAFVGPKQINIGGYNALSYTTTMKGDYYIEFKSSVSFNLFDITVASSTNQPQTGRLWARSWDFSLPDYNTPFEGTAFIYADDGIVTSIQFKELKPCVFTLIANRTGCQKTGNYITDRLSVNGQKNYPQYRIFFNNPDTIAYPSGTYGKLTAPTTLTGCDGNFCLNFSVNKTGPIQILLDLNGVSGYQPNTEDVVITDTARNVGLNCIPWNGKNGKGKPVPANARIFIDVNYFNGLTNLPLYDVESDSTGYYVKLVRPPATDSIPYLFWDDSHIYDSRFGYGSKNLTGCQDLVNGCHQWYYDFGDERTINTWWYANVLKADLLMNLKYASVETNKFLLYGQKSDTTVCLGPTDNTLQLNGYYTEANGAIWSTSGTGTFIPDNTTMNAVYKFSDADISKGSVLLILKTTGTKTGCLDVSDSMPVKIIRTNAFSAGADQTICRGSSATLTASGGSGSSSYSWIPGGVKTASIVVYPTQTTTYNVQINTGNCKAADNVVVTVNSPNISAGADQTICVGASTKLSASGGNTYSWSTSEKTTSITVNPATSKTYYVTGTDNSALACTAVDNVVVNIGPFTTDAGTDQTVCYGESTTLTASGASTFTWSNGDKTGTITLNNLTSTKTFIVTATSGSCTATDSVKVNVIQMNVSAIANPAKICIGGGSVLTASGAVSYEWSTGAIGSDAPVTPKITTTYIVTGTNSGCTGTASVVVNLATSINVGATANPGTLCSGESSVLKGSGANSYSWYTGTVNDSITVSPTETTTYIVKGTSGGCTGTASTVVKYTSSLNVTTTANTTSICLGKNSTITANGADSYSWSTGVSGASITVTPTITTTYYVTGTSGKCTGTSSIVITVNSSIAVSATASPSTICSGSGSVITASGATKYSWSTGPTSASISVKPTTTTTYKVTGTSGSCTGTAMATVTVNANPTVTVKSPSICTGSSATLTASGATTYSWSTSQTVNSISVNPTTNTTYKVTGTTSGCTGTTTATVTVNPLPTISVNSPAICSGKSTTLTAAGGSAYSWSTSQTVNPITVSPTITSTYYVTGTDANSCKNTAQSVVNVASALTVTVNSPTICNGVSATLTANGATTYSWTNSATTNPITVSPTTTTTYKVTGASGSCTGTAMATVTVNANPIVTVNSPSICTGSSATITASGANTYSWSTSQTVNPITVSLTTNTTYKVTGTTSGCTGTAQSVVTVNSNPVVNVNNESICKGSSVILTATGAVTYSWTTAQNINPITVSPATNTTYTVTGNDSNGCSGTAWSIVNVSTVIPNAGTDQTICSGISATINASGATTYSWNNNLGTGASKTVNPTSTTIYTVTGTTGICSGTDNVTIFVDPSFTTSAGADRTITEGQTSTISAVDGNSFVWSSSDKTQSFVAKPSVNTTYIVTAKKATCTATAQVIVTVNPYVKADAGNNQTICIGNSTILTATGGDSYTWSN